MKKKINKKTDSKKVSIKNNILIVFIIILLIAIGSVGYITYTNWIDSINKTITKTVDTLNIQITNEIDSFMTNAKRLNIVNKEYIESGLADINNKQEREKLFVNALISFDCDQVYSFSYGSQTGEYYGARKNKDNKVELMINNEETNGHTWYYSVKEDKTLGQFVLDAGLFDSRERPWYTQATKTEEITFSKIYKHFLLDDLAISSSISVLDKDQQIQGVLGSHMNLSRINQFLKDIMTVDGGYTAIVEKDTGDLVGNSLGMPNFRSDEEGGFLRLSINDTENEVLKNTYNNYIKGDGDKYKIEDKDGNTYIKLIEYKDKGLDWIIITALPDKILVAPVKDNIKVVLALTFLAILLASLVFSVLTKRYLDPINDLILVQEKFAKGDLLKRAIITKNDEIGLVAKSFNNMANTIYDLINTLEEKVEERTSELNKSNKAMIENKDHLSLILNSTGEGIYGVDLNENCTFINSSGLKILGYDDQSELIGKNMHNKIHHSYKDGRVMDVGDCSILKALKKEEPVYVSDEVFWKKDKTFVSVAYSSHLQYLDNKIVGSVVVFVDNTERKRMEKSLFTEKEYFKATLLSVGDGVISTDSSGVITVMNPVAEKLTGWTIKEAYGKKLEEVLVTINELDKVAFNNSVEKVLGLEDIEELDNYVSLVSKDKKLIPIDIIASEIKDGEGNKTGVVITIRDFTDKKEKLEKIKYLSMHDQLTGIYNRWYMDDAIKKLDTEKNLPITLMTIDVNGLKLVNDAFGHKMGDQLLKTVTSVLVNVLRKEDIIGRMGGDEFLLILPKTGEKEAEDIKNKIIESIAKIKLDFLVVSVALGYEVKEYEYEQIENILASSDNRMYKNKLKYGEAMRMQTVERITQKINEKYNGASSHLEKVSYYCGEIGLAIGFTEDEIERVKSAGKVHDIGKIIIPEEILNTDKAIVGKEFEILKKHSETGYRILKSIDEYALIAEDVLYHHERWDGSGYPKGLKGEEIPVNSRIIAIADAYESMTSDRSYQIVKSKEEAISELKRCSGEQFDPDIVKVFIEKVLMKPSTI